MEGGEWVVCVSSRPDKDMKVFGLNSTGAIVLAHQDLDNSAIAKRYRAELRTKRGQKFIRKYKRLRGDNRS